MAKRSSRSRDRQSIANLEQHGAWRQSQNAGPRSGSQEAFSVWLSWLRRPEFLERASRWAGSWEDAEDAVQTVALRIVEKPQFREHLRMARSAKAYLAQTVRNVCRDLVEAHCRQRLLCEGEAIRRRHCAPASPLLDPLDLPEVNRLLDELASDLTSRQRQLLVLLREDPWSTAPQLAVGLGCSAENVRQMWGRIRQVARAKEELEPYAMAQ